MRAYADTNFMTRLYVPTSDLAQVNRLLSRHLNREGEVLPFTPLHRLEFRNAIRLMVHRRKQPGEVNLTASQARQILRDQESDLAEAVFMAPRAIDWTEALRDAEKLSAAYTETEGFRSLDLVHVGAALHLGATEFYSFDKRARRIAKFAELEVLPH